MGNDEFQVVVHTTKKSSFSNGLLRHKVRGFYYRFCLSWMNIIYSIFFYWRHHKRSPWGMDLRPQFIHNHYYWITFDLFWWTRLSVVTRKMLYNYLGFSYREIWYWRFWNLFKSLVYTCCIPLRFTPGLIIYLKILSQIRHWMNALGLIYRGNEQTSAAKSWSITKY